MVVPVAWHVILCRRVEPCNVKPVRYHVHSVEKWMNESQRTTLRGKETPLNNNLREEETQSTCAMKHRVNYWYECLHRDYLPACSLVPSIATDAELSGQEQIILNLLKAAAKDSHPDARAACAHIALALADCRWSLCVHNRFSLEIFSE